MVPSLVFVCKPVKIEIHFKQRTKDNGKNNGVFHKSHKIFKFTALFSLQFLALAVSVIVQITANAIVKENCNQRLKSFKNHLPIAFVKAPV